MTNILQVYRICDVIRGAHSLAIAVNRSKTGTRSVSTTDEMLQQWGRRVWTFPEVLLSPAGKDIKIYVRGNDLMSPIIVAKNQFAATVWNDDAKIARQVGSPQSLMYSLSADESRLDQARIYSRLCNLGRLNVLGNNIYGQVDFLAFNR